MTDKDTPIRPETFDDFNYPLPMEYLLELEDTSASSGYFGCVPKEERVFSSGLAYLRERPYDEFLHKRLLNAMQVLPQSRIVEWIKETGPGAEKEADKVFRAMLYEACILYERFNPLLWRFKAEEIEELAAHTPLVYIKSFHMPDHELHLQWMAAFAGNIGKHQLLPKSADAGVSFPVSDEAIKASERIVPVQKIRLQFISDEKIMACAPQPPETVAKEAITRLERMGVLEGTEMRHMTSLSPMGLLRKWHMGLRVVNGRLDYLLSGIQTSYGRGIDENSARASCAMEVAERVSSFAGIGDQGVLDRTYTYPLTHARYSELKNDGIEALDPNRLHLEAPYNDEPLYWISGERAHGTAVLVPAQCIFLFANLDEISLFSGLGSTGLASGTTLTGAKVSALLECIERDAEGTTPFHLEGCFTLETDDPEISKLLAEYREKGVQVWFQEITSAFGVPCFKSFVIGPDGEIAKGVGAHLNGRRALLSAMTETPYPFPSGPPSLPGPPDLPARKLEDLPDFSTGRAETDLELLEGLLTENRAAPIYVEITRSDLSIPVVRAIVPGLALSADFDRFSRVHPRLFANYLRMYG